MKIKVSIILGLLLMTNFHCSIASHNDFDSDLSEELILLSSGLSSNDSEGHAVASHRQRAQNKKLKEEQERQRQERQRQEQERFKINLKIFQDLDSDQKRIDMGWSIIVGDPGLQHNQKIVDMIPKNPYKQEKKLDPMYAFSVGQIRKFLNKSLDFSSRPETKTPSKEESAYGHFKGTTWNQMQEALRYLNIIP